MQPFSYTMASQPTGSEDHSGYEYDSFLGDEDDEKSPQVFSCIGLSTEIGTKILEEQVPKSVWEKLRTSNGLVRSTEAPLAAPTAAVQQSWSANHSSHMLETAQADTKKRE
jgi:hypothetical protein